MSKNYVELAKEVDKGAKALAQQASETMGAFRNLASVATKHGALDHKTKELMALAIAIATGCDACIAYHTRNVVKAGANIAEVIETIGVSMEMGGGPAMVYGAAALEAYEEFVQEDLSSEKVG